MGEVRRSGVSQRNAWVMGGVFLSLFALLQLGWQGLHGTAVERFIIHTCTVRPAAFWVSLLTPTVQVRVVDFSLRAAGGGLNILNGCEGVEAVFLILAAFLAAPLPWRSRGLGFLLGLAVVFVVNQARILALFYAFRADHSLFERLHGTVTPIVVILVMCLYVYVWLVYANRRDAAAA